MAATCSPPHLGAHLKTPNHMAQQRNPPGAHLEPTLHCMGEREEPTRSPPGTHREPSRNLHGRARGTHAEPTRAHQEPTGNPPQTVSKTAQESTSHPLVFIILFIRGKGDAVGNIETLLELYSGCSSEGTSNSRKTFQTESRTQDRAGSLVGLLEQ